MLKVGKKIPQIFPSFVVVLFLKKQFEGYNPLSFQYIQACIHFHFEKNRQNSRRLT